MSRKVQCPWCGREISLQGFGTDREGRAIFQWHYLPNQDPTKTGQECKGSHRAPESWLQVSREKLWAQIVADPDLPSEAGGACRFGRGESKETAND